MRIFSHLEYTELKAGSTLRLVYKPSTQITDSDTELEKKEFIIHEKNNILYIDDTTDNKPQRREIFTQDRLDTYLEQHSKEDIIDFSYAVFANEIDFREYDFSIHKRVSFDNAVFGYYASFYGATFSDEAIFYDATFGDKARFEYAIFGDEARFGGATFGDEAGFDGVTFGNSANFQEIQCKNKISFSDANFNSVDLYSALMSHLNFNITINEKTHINLLSTQIDTIIFDKLTDLKVDNGANRETFNRLKSLALQQHNQIQALDFHTLEMERYYLDLGATQGKYTEKFLLGFEKHTSTFGTNYLKALGWYICLALLSYCFMLWFSGEWASTQSFIRYLSPVSHDLTKVFEGLEVTLGTGLFFLVYKIMQFVLLYEIIKSFRKYSRKL